MTAALEGGPPAAPAAGSGSHGLLVAAEGGLPLDSLLLLLLSSSLPMRKPAQVGVETPDCGLPSLGELGGVEAPIRGLWWPWCACCSMKASMNRPALILYCFTVRSLQSSHGGYLNWYLLHSFSNCPRWLPWGLFFPYLFSSCSWLSISLTCPNASRSLSGAAGPLPPPPQLLLGLGGVGGLGGCVVALPPGTNPVGAVDSCPCQWLAGDQDWWWWVIAPSFQPVMVFIVHEQASLSGLSPVSCWLMEPPESCIPFLDWPPFCPSSGGRVQLELVQNSCRKHMCFTKK